MTGKNPCITLALLVLLSLAYLPSISPCGATDTASVGPLASSSLELSVEKPIVARLDYQTLYARFLLDGSPVAQVVVTFEVIYPDATEYVWSNRTDVTGEASVRFTIPPDASAPGTCWVHATAYTSEGGVVVAAPQSFDIPLFTFDSIELNDTMVIRELETLKVTANIIASWNPTETASNVVLHIYYPGGVPEYYLDMTYNGITGLWETVWTPSATDTLGMWNLGIEAFDTYGYSQISSIYTFEVTLDVFPPTWDEVPTDQVVEFGSSFTYDIDASDISGIDRYWLNDTTNFHIDGDGVITNVGPLAIGIHGLEVRAYDIRDNFVSAEFSVTVQDTTPPTWVTTPSDQILEFGEPLSYQLEASDLSGIDYWSISDTTNFRISSNGRLTNATFLAPGNYNLIIHAFDPYGNSVSATITITVNEPTTTTTTGPGIPGFPALAIILGIIAALGLFYHLRRKPR